MSVVLHPTIEISFPLMLDTNPLANIEVSHYGEALRQFKNHSKINIDSALLGENGGAQNSRVDRV